MADLDRLTRLADILDSVDDNPRFERIRRLSDEIRNRTTVEPDRLDKLMMRLLLDEYAHALAHLRANARECATNIEKVPSALKDVRRVVHGRAPTLKQSV